MKRELVMEQPGHSGVAKTAHVASVSVAEKVSDKPRLLLRALFSVEAVQMSLTRGCHYSSVATVPGAHTAVGVAPFGSPHF